MYSMKKREIETFEDIQLMVDEFYGKAMISPVIGHFFNEVIELDLVEHMPIMHNFWSDILLGTKLYYGNPMIKHFALNKKSKMTPAHFQEWIRLWKANIQEHFVGAKAEEAISRAENIAKLMSHKVSQQ